MALPKVVWLFCAVVLLASMGTIFFSVALYSQNSHEVLPAISLSIGMSVDGRFLADAGLSHVQTNAVISSNLPTSMETSTLSPQYNTTTVIFTAEVESSTAPIEHNVSRDPLTIEKNSSLMKIKTVAKPLNKDTTPDYPRRTIFSDPPTAQTISDTFRTEEIHEPVEGISTSSLQIIRAISKTKIIVGHSESNQQLPATGQPPTATTLSHMVSAVAHSRPQSSGITTSPPHTLPSVTQAAPRPEILPAHQPASRVPPQRVSSAPLTLSTDRPHGYVLAVNYYEQQTMGLRNMFQLQCWAQFLDLLVVKPVMQDSFLRTPLDSELQAKYLPFEASFNLSQWNEQALKHQYAPLVEWGQFLSRAPRDVIVVQFEHPSVSLLKSRQRSGQGLLHSPDPKQFGSGCSEKWPTASELHFLQSHRFRVVQSVCFNFYYGDQLTLEAFNKHLLNGRRPDSVSIILEMWRGISSAQRVLLKDVCHNSIVQEYIGLSTSLNLKAEQYTHKYLQGQPYLAIMGRLEITQLTVHKKVPVVPFCLEETLTALKDFKRETSLDNTFLSIDIGRYGTKKYRSKLDPTIELAFNKFFQSLFGQSATVKNWEKSFELVSGVKDAGYIGLLQKVLVTRAKCILFVGGGAFQRHALILYKKLHPLPKDQCYRVVKKCTRAGKLE